MALFLKRGEYSVKYEVPTYPLLSICYVSVEYKQLLTWMNECRLQSFLTWLSYLYSILVIYSFIQQTFVILSTGKSSHVVLTH